MKVKTKELVNVIIYFILLLPFFKPSYIGSEIPKLSTIYNIMQILAMTVIVCLYLKRRKCSKFFMGVCVFEAILLFSTIVSGQEIIETIFDIVRTLSVCMILEYGITKDCKSLFRALLFIFEILLCINLFTILAFPKGMYIQYLTTNRNNWFLGNDNQHIKYILIGCCISLIYSIQFHNKILIRTIVLCAISAITVAIRLSATGVIGSIVFIVLLLYIFLLRNKARISAKFLSIVYIVLFLGIVIFRLQNLFAFIIVDILHKDITFTGRTHIWDFTFEYIKQKLLLGCGVESTQTRLIKYADTHVIGAVNSHNQILETIYQGGIILLLVFVYIISLSIKKLEKNKKNICTKILICTTFALFVAMLTEVFNMQIIFILLLLGYHVDKIIKETKGEKNWNLEEQEKVSLI